MTISVAKEHEIRRLRDVEKWKPGTIASELGVHPDVVTRVLDRGESSALSAAPKPRLLVEGTAFIEEPLKAHPRLRATPLVDMLRGREYEGGIAIVRRYGREVRPTPRGEVYLRAERLIGEPGE